MSKKNTLVTSQFLTPAAPSQGVKVMDRDEFGPVFTGPGLSSAERIAQANRPCANYSSRWCDNLAGLNRPYCHSCRQKMRAEVKSAELDLSKPRPTARQQVRHGRPVSRAGIGPRGAWFEGVLKDDARRAARSS